MTPARDIRCGEAGHAEAERWSTWWAPSDDDRAALISLRARQLLDLEHRGDGRIRVAGTNSCGHIRLPSGQVIDVRSKIPTLRLLEWLVYTELLPDIDFWEEEEAISARGTWIEAILHLFVHELARVTRFYRRAGYVTASDTTIAVRGRVDAGRLAKVAGRLPSLPCTFRDRTMDTLPNGVLANALDAAAAWAATAAVGEACATTLGWLTREWRGIDRDIGYVERALQDALERPPVGYRVALRLARLVLLGGTADDTRGEGGDMFLVNMSVVWEKALRRLLAGWAYAHGHRVATPGERTRQWADTDDSERTRWLTADAIVFAERPVVLDAKYKCAYGDESRVDRFQMAAYALAFGAQAAILVYPTAVERGRIRLLLRATAPGSAAEVHAAELPMALGPTTCAAELEALLGGQARRP
jgi:5-methylcytosine-specific restriction endonuclease McrBC regulatory subunit McrC